MATLNLLYLASMWAKWPHNPYLWGYPTLRAGTKSTMASAPLPSRGPTCLQSGYITDAALGVFKTTRGDKITNGYLTPATNITRTHQPA